MDTSRWVTARTRVVSQSETPTPFAAARRSTSAGSDPAGTVIMNQAFVNVGAWIAGPFMAAGNWAMPYSLAGAVYLLTFLAFYGYFARVETARAVAVESATA